MNEAISFFIPYEVLPKQSMVAGRNIHTGQPLCRTRKRTRDNAKALTMFAAAHRPDVPLTGALRLTLVFMYPWRKAEPLKNRAKGKRPKDTLPDLENLTKQLVDVLERTGFFANDGAISSMRLDKFWTSNVGVSVLLEMDDRWLTN